MVFLPLSSQSHCFLTLLFDYLYCVVLVWLESIFVCFYVQFLWSKYYNLER